jgi:hypothetical protein
LIDISIKQSSRVALFDCQGSLKLTSLRETPPNAEERSTTVWWEMASIAQWGIATTAHVGIGLLSAWTGKANMRWTDKAS